MQSSRSSAPNEICTKFIVQNLSSMLLVATYVVLYSVLHTCVGGCPVGPRCCRGGNFHCAITSTWLGQSLFEQAYITVLNAKNEAELKESVQGAVSRSIFWWWKSSQVPWLMLFSSTSACQRLLLWFRKELDVMVLLLPLLYIPRRLWGHDPIVRILGLPVHQRSCWSVA